jgi:hypothetical protein
MLQNRMKVAGLAIAAVSGALVAALFLYSGSQIALKSAQVTMDGELRENSIADALNNDEVYVRVHDSMGNLKYEEETHNIITTAGAIWFCVQQDRCESHITSPAITSTANPTWWVQFVSGTPNSNSPTGADCTAPSGGGALSGQVSGNRCVTNFGSAPAQYQSGGSIITVSGLAGSGQLRGTGTYDTTNNFVQTTKATLCSVVDDGTAPSSGTCQFSDTTPVLTNLSGSTITVDGLALASGSGSSTTAGALIIAESAISSVTLNPGDTISVSWTIVT